MRIIRLLLVLTVLFAMAQPTFACLTCGFTDCTNAQPGDPRCKVTRDGCTDGLGFCPGGLQASMASEWTVASVEVSRPAAAPSRTVSAQSTRIAAASTHTKALR
jgi:hypothetical protein